MKKAALIVLSLSVMLSCQRKTETKICGQIDGYNGKPIHIFPAESVYSRQVFGESNASSYTSMNGEFCITLLPKEAMFYHLVSDDGNLVTETPIEIHKGDSVWVKTSIYNNSFPKFCGDNKTFNNFIVDFRHSLNAAFRNLSYRQKSEAEFCNFADSILSTHALSVDSLKIHGQVSSNATNLLLAELELTVAANRLSYLRYHLYDTEARWEYYTPNNNFYHFSNGLLGKHSNFWFLPSYSQAVEAELEDKYQRFPKGEMHNEFEQKTELITTDFHGIAKEVALCQLANRFTIFLASDRFFQVLPQTNSLMRQSNSQPALQNYFEKKYLQVSALQTGSKAPVFSLPNREGKKVSLESFRGRVVLLTFWGTWCPPCLSNIPKYIEIQEHFSKEDVAFVFIALEARSSDVENWKNFISGESQLSKDITQGKPFPGIHLVAKQQFRNPEIEPYAISFAPSYILIDRDGEIAYPRVSFNDELIKIIEELLEKHK